jgi:hypothetical protein
VVLHLLQCSVRQQSLPHCFVIFIFGWAGRSILCCNYRVHFSPPLLHPACQSAEWDKCVMNGPEWRDNW